MAFKHLHIPACVISVKLHPQKVLAAFGHAMESATEIDYTHYPHKLHMITGSEILIIANILVRSHETRVLLLRWTCISEHEVHNPTCGADTG